MDASYQPARPQSGNALLILALVAICAAALIALAGLPSAAPAASVSGNVIVDRKYSHAWEHEDQDIVRNCLDSGRTWKRWYSARQPGRYMRVCYDGQNIILQIVDRIKNDLWERTAYVDRDLKTINDVEEYAKSVQYLRIKAP